MKNNYFKSIESASLGQAFPLDKAINELSFNDQGLIAVITQDFTSKDVRMMAWMNLSALLKTLDTGQMTYWSRSRNALWIKGETSGHTQELVEMSFDCDGDTILCKVNQKGAACHTRRPNCFYLKTQVQNNQIVVVSEQIE